MILSGEGLDYLKRVEGSKDTMYRDSAGLPTIGVGHLLSRSELSSGKLDGSGVPFKSRPLTDDEITTLLKDDVAEAEHVVTSRVQVPLVQHQFDSLVSLCFNIGGFAFEGSTLLRLLNGQHYDSVPEQMRRWIHSGGQVDPGLVKRRERDVRLWLGEYHAHI